MLNTDADVAVLHPVQFRFLLLLHIYIGIHSVFRVLKMKILNEIVLMFGLRKNAVAHCAAPPLAVLYWKWESFILRFPWCKANVYVYIEIWRRIFNKLREKKKKTKENAIFFSGTMFCCIKYVVFCCAVLTAGAVCIPLKSYFVHLHIFISYIIFIYSFFTFFHTRDSCIPSTGDVFVHCSSCFIIKKKK